MSRKRYTPEQIIGLLRRLTLHSSLHRRAVTRARLSHRGWTT
jgi:hypothetical protein